jgi:hypothetical protein
MPKRARTSEASTVEMLTAMMKRTMDKDEQLEKLREEDTQRRNQAFAAREAALLETIRELEGKLNSTELISTHALLERERQLDSREDAVRSMEDRVHQRPVMRRAFVFTYTGMLIDATIFNFIAGAAPQSQLKEIIETTDSGMHFCRLSFNALRTEEYVMALIKKYHAHMVKTRPATFVMAFSPVFVYNAFEPWRAAIVNNRLVSPAVRFARAPTWAWITRDNDNYARAVLGDTAVPTAEEKSAAATIAQIGEERDV